VPPDWLLAPLDVVAIVAVAWVGGTAMQRLRQPRIAGEMAAVFAGALLLGGQIAGVAEGRQAAGRIGELVPPAGAAVITVVGGLGLILYMLLVGLRIDPAPVRERAGTIALLAATTTGATVALALVAGPLLADGGGWKPAAAGDGAFVIALAAALAASGVPIVARILEDRAMQHSAVGAIVIVASAGVTALALVASAVAIDGGDVGAAGRVALRLGAAGAVLIVLVALARRHRRLAPGPGVAVPAVVVLAVLCGLASDWLLSSPLLGPLVVGVVVRAGGDTALGVERRLGWTVRRVGLPVFLGLAALHTDLRELGSGVLAAVLALLAAVIAVKLIAGYAAARLAGFVARDARAIGALLQCGGVMTLAISLALLDAGVIDGRLHATLTLVGLMTTIAAGPLLPPRWRGDLAHPSPPDRT
jgi:Kef-type K+ transport system membrane component KefB